MSYSCNLFDEKNDKNGKEVKEETVGNPGDVPGMVDRAKGNIEEKRTVGTTT